MKSPDIGGGQQRPHNLDLSTLRVSPEQKPVGWGVKKPEGQFQQAPKSGEFLLPPRQSEGVSGGHSIQPNPGEHHSERSGEPTPEGENPHRFRFRRSRKNPDNWALEDPTYEPGSFQFQLEFTPDILESSTEAVQGVFSDIPLVMREYYKYLARRRSQPPKGEDQK